jgi:hypothetical protein
LGKDKRERGSEQDEAESHPLGKREARIGLGHKWLVGDLFVASGSLLSISVCFPIAGMRSSSAVILHIDLIAALEDGIPFFLASNGAVLTSGKADTGYLPLQYVLKAEASKSGQVIWSSTSVQ